MGLQKCKRCKKIFAASNGKICPDCLQEEEEKFKIVKDYLWDNPGATIDQIHEDTGVDTKLIHKFVREGRFLQIDGVELKVECERCGTPIVSGRFCKECSEKLKSGIGKIKKSSKKKKEVKKKGHNRMFVGNRHKRR